MSIGQTVTTIIFPAVFTTEFTHPSNETSTSDTQYLAYFKATDSATSEVLEALHQLLNNTIAASKDVSCARMQAVGTRLHLGWETGLVQEWDSSSRTSTISGALDISVHVTGQFESVTSYSAFSNEFADCVSKSLNGTGLVGSGDNYAESLKKLGTLARKLTSRRGSNLPIYSLTSVYIGQGLAAQTSCDEFGNNRAHLRGSLASVQAQMHALRVKLPEQIDLKVRTVRSQKNQTYTFSASVLKQDAE